MTAADTRLASPPAPVNRGWERGATPGLAREAKRPQPLDDRRGAPRGQVRGRREHAPRHSGHPELELERRPRAPALAAARHLLTFLALLLPGSAEAAPPTDGPAAAEAATPAGAPAAAGAGAPRQAEARVLVLVGGHGPVDDVAARVADELALRGHGAVRGALSESEAAVATDAVSSRRVGASADAAVGVWLRGEHSALVVVSAAGEPVSQEVDTGSGASFASAVALVAGEAVDLALERARTAPVPAPAPRPEPAPEPPPPPPRRTIEGDAGASVEALWPTRARVPMGRVGVEVGLRPTRRLRLAVRGGLPLHPMAATTAAGEVRTLIFEVGPRVGVNLLSPSAPVALDLRLGADLLALRVDVRGTNDASSTAASGAARLGLWVRWRHEHLELAGGVPVAIPFERLKIRAAGELAQDLSGAWIGLALRLSGWWGRRAARSPRPARP